MLSDNFRDTQDWISGILLNFLPLLTCTHTHTQMRAHTYTCTHFNKDTDDR